MEELQSIAVIVNGVLVRRVVPSRRHLTDFLRLDLGLTGTHLGCEHGVCGACTVKVDGAAVRGCLMLAVQADGCIVETIEGLSDSGALTELQDAFVRHNALQCGFCTPGMLLAAAEMLAAGRHLSRDQIRDGLSGNICRCTGYQQIVDAVAAVQADRGVA
jgi:carbon-monoxide dehydrogenase small subunit